MSVSKDGLNKVTVLRTADRKNDIMLWEEEKDTPGRDEEEQVELKKCSLKGNQKRKWLLPHRAAEKVSKGKNTEPAKKGKTSAL